MSRSDDRRSSSGGDFIAVLNIIEQLMKRKRATPLTGAASRNSDARDIRAYFQITVDAGELPEPVLHCWPRSANTTCAKVCYVIAWVIRIISVLSQTLQWMPLHLGLLQLNDQHPDQVPKFLKNEPYSYLVLAGLMGGLATFYFIRPYDTLEGYGQAFVNYKTAIPACNKKPGALARIICIGIFALAGTGLAAALFFAITQDPLYLDDEGFLGELAVVLKAIAAMDLLYQFLYWIPNILMHASSGLSLAVEFVDFMIYVFKDQLAWREYQRIRFLKKLQSDPTILNTFVSAIVQVASEEEGDVDFERRLVSVQRKMNSENALAVSLYFHHQKSPCSRFGESVAFFMLSVIIHYGTLSFYLAAFRILPLELAFIEIIVSFKTLSQLSEGMLLFFKQTPDFKNKILNVPAAVCLMAILLFWGAYTSSGAVTEVFLQASADCLSNISMNNCTAETKALLSGEIITSCVSLFVLNLDPIFYLFDLIQSRCLIRLRAQKHGPSRRKWAIENFRKNVKGLLENASLDDMNSLSSESSRFKNWMPLDMDVDQRAAYAVLFVFFLLLISYIAVGCFAVLPNETAVILPENNTFLLLDWHDYDKPGVLIPIALLAGGDLMKRAVLACVKLFLKSAHNRVLTWVGVFVPVIPNVLLLYVLFYLSSHLIELGVKPELVNMTQEEEKNSTFFLLLLMCFLGGFVAGVVSTLLNSCMGPNSVHSRRQSQRVSAVSMVPTNRSVVTEVSAAGRDRSPSPARNLVSPSVGEQHRAPARLGGEALFRAISPPPGGILGPRSISPGTGLFTPTGSLRDLGSGSISPGIFGRFTPARPGRALSLTGDAFLTIPAPVTRVNRGDDGSESQSQSPAGDRLSASV